MALIHEYRMPRFLQDDSHSCTLSFNHNVYLVFLFGDLAVLVRQIADVPSFRTIVLNQTILLFSILQHKMIKNKARKIFVIS